MTPVMVQLPNYRLARSRVSRVLSRHWQRAHSHVDDDHTGRFISATLTALVRGWSGHGVLQFEASLKSVRSHKNGALVAARRFSCYKWLVQKPLGWQAAPIFCALSHPCHCDLSLEFYRVFGPFFFTFHLEGPPHTYHSASGGEYWQNLNEKPTWNKTTKSNLPLWPQF